MHDARTLGCHPSLFLTRSMLRMMRFSIMTGFRSIQHSAASMIVRIVATDSMGYLFWLIHPFIGSDQIG